MRKAESCPLGERAATFGERLDALPSAEICFACSSSGQNAPARVNAKLVICLPRRSSIAVEAVQRVDAVSPRPQALRDKGKREEGWILPARRAGGYLW